MKAVFVQIDAHQHFESVHVIRSPVQCYTRVFFILIFFFVLYFGFADPSRRSTYYIEQENLYVDLHVDNMRIFFPYVVCFVLKKKKIPLYKACDIEEVSK